MSDSLWPHGLYTLWNSPGQNTGVGRLSLLQGNPPNPGIKPRSPSLQVDSLPTELKGDLIYTSQSSQNLEHDSTTRRWGCCTAWTLSHCWWECKVIQPLWNSVWQCLTKLKYSYHMIQQWCTLVFTQRSWNLSPHKTCTLTFRVVLFIIAQTQKQPRCPLVEKWIKCGTCSQ